MDVELVAAADLDSLFQDWERLYRADDLATPFNSPWWGRAWLEDWDPGAEPWLMRVHESGRVAGVAPLALRRTRSVRILSMVGKEPGDYWDVVAAPGDRERVAAAVGTELVRLRRRWDASVLSCLPPESPTLQGFEASGLRIFRRTPIASPALALPETFEAYLSSLPSSRRQNLRQHLRRLDSGEIGLREVSGAAELSEVMQRWRDLRSRQWSGMGRQITPEHEQDRFHRFMLNAVARLLDARLAVVWELSREDCVAGVYVNFADDRSFYLYLGGFDPRFKALGLGKIAIVASLRTSIEAGRRLYDFTRGDDAYKYWYGASDRWLASVVVGHRRPRSRLALAGAQVLSAYRARSTLGRDG
jgi:CelD/BcsL family acetyltransferase involved in cellulose biosynthesis